MSIQPFRGVWPEIASSAFIAEGVPIIGDVHIGAESGIWFGCVIRGDVNSIRIGARTNIQDGTVIHVTRKTGPTFVGDGVTVGHRALLHGCTLMDGSFVGMAATVMDGVIVETGAWVAAGALVSPGKRVPRGEIWAGVPARFLRRLTPEEEAYIAISSQNYVELSREFMVPQLNSLG